MVKYCKIWFRLALEGIAMQQQMTHSTLARHHCLFLSRRNQMSPCSHVQQGFPTLAGLTTKVWADKEAPDSWSVGGTKHESLLARMGLRPRGSHNCALIGLIRVMGQSQSIRMDFITNVWCVRRDKKKAPAAYNQHGSFQIHL